MAGMPVIVPRYGTQIMSDRDKPLKGWGAEERDVCAHGIPQLIFLLNFGENSLTKKLAKTDVQLSLVEVG